jgi:tetratricopeptide (TPR) repeat protein
MTDAAAGDFERAELLVRRVLSMSPRSPIAHYAYGQVLRATRRNEQAIPEYQEALEFNPNWADALAGLGWCKFWVGSLDEAVALQEQAVRLSPRDPQIGYWYYRIGMVYLLQSRIGQAIPWLEKDPHLPAGLLFSRCRLCTQRRDRARRCGARRDLSAERKALGIDDRRYAGDWLLGTTQDSRVV